MGQGEGDGRATARTARPGTEPGQHILEVEVGLDELAAILGEELELPRIQPRGRRTVPVEKVKLLEHPPAWGRRACATSSARSARP